ncbi:hypothetical protein [Mycobacterium sp.]|uniref:hypothetical protein n=1 Tax=Mycobacterium sp. TaxID=1785 RepID=UPI003C718067
MDNHHRFSDETPVADAVEQEQETTPAPAAADREIPPVEADASDWQEQHQEIADDDRDEYRDEYRD